MKDPTIEMLPVESLLPYAGNARTHTPKQVNQIAKSIKAFGFMNPVLIDAQNQLIAGHGRLLAAKQLGLPRVPAIRAEHLTESQCRAYLLADNKIAENAGWDQSLLRVELEFLVNVDFDVDLTGFATPELDVLFHPDGERTAEPPIVEVPSPADTVSMLGDVWSAGPHRVLCGDCRDNDALLRVLGDERARMVITDPPYNVPIGGHVSGLGKNQHDEFAMASGEMTPEEFTGFLTGALGPAVDCCIDGALIYTFMDWRHLQELYAAAANLNVQPINMCVWVKSNGGMGSLYRSQHEFVLVTKKSGGAHVNNVELGKHGRYRTNVWNYAGMNTFGAERGELLACHPTVKPVAMIRDAIMDASYRGEIVLDSFLGSGTTLLAAHQSRRRCVGIELDPRYVDVALRRWMQLTGDPAVHADSGLTFGQESDRRRQAAA